MYGQLSRSDFAIDQPSETGTNVELSTDTILLYWTGMGGLGVATQGNLVVAAYVRELVIPNYQDGGKLVFRKSRDGGRTWDPPLILKPTATRDTLWATRVAIDGCGAIYVVVDFAWLSQGMIYKSMDGGTTFTGPTPFNLPQYSGQTSPVGNIVQVAERPPCNEFYATAYGLPGEDLNTYLLVSNDGAQTFTAYPHEIFFNVPDYPGGGSPEFKRSASGALFIARIAPDDPVNGGPIYKSQIYLYRSDDGGQTLQLMNRKIIDAAAFTADVFTSISLAVSPSGKDVYIGWLNLPDKTWQERQWMMSVSHDGGTTFAAPVQFNDLPYEGAFNFATVAESGGKVCAAYQSSRNTLPYQPWPGIYHDQLMLTCSRDGGRTFSEPKRMNDLLKPRFQAYGMWTIIKFIPANTGDDGTIHFIWTEDRYAGGSTDIGERHGPVIMYTKFHP